ncbi:MAG: DUF488 domain-containing protein [Proteobacteria bacterium]|nr:DUF488 domain-containing protein [Pseudomonadota bacterium]
MNGSLQRRPRLFTLGHSDRTLEQFLAILESSSIKIIADVRSNPASSRFPHFERRALSSELEKRGLVYRWFRDLGGRRPNTREAEEHTALETEGFRRYAVAMNTAEFAVCAEDLLGLAASAITALLCAERDFRYCHRNILSDKLEEMGARVVHIVDMKTAEEHIRHPDLLVEQGRLIYRKKQLDLLR